MGKTTGPATNESVLSEELRGDVTVDPIINFKKIEGHVKIVPDKILRDLSQDQPYLYEILMAVQSGQAYFRENPGLATNNPGLLNHSRWLTKANRILQLYCFY